MKTKKLLAFFLLIAGFYILSCGGGGSSDNENISPTPTPTSTPDTAPYAPEESVHPNSYLRHPTPPEGFPVVVGWMQAIDITGQGEESLVEIDWMRLYCQVDGADVLLKEDTFDAETVAMSSYGLYLRDPWFGQDDYHESMPFLVEDSLLVMEPHLNPDRVYHWWNTSRAEIPVGATKVWFEARVRITGGAGVQAGMDYWISTDADWCGWDVCNSEAGASDWFGNSTSEWQIITVGD